MIESGENPHVYLERVHISLESLVVRVQVSHAMLRLAQLSLQLGLQLPAALLELQQLLLGLLVAVEGEDSSAHSHNNWIGALTKMHKPAEFCQIDNLLPVPPL